MYKNIVTQRLKDPLFEIKNIRVDALRLDRIHPDISGNKWFKLRYHLAEAIQQNKTGIVTFGGAYSNHLVATAYACKENGLFSTAIIRGEEPEIYGPTLQQLKQYGMQLIFADRAAYRDKDALARTFLVTNSSYYYVPEGGQSDLGIKGAAEIMQHAETGYSHIVCAVGTGTTITGIINSCRKDQQIIGISSLKVGNAIENELLSYIQKYSGKNNFSLMFDYHFGGYARKTDELIIFMNRFYNIENIPTDFVYTGKLFYAVDDMVKKDYFPTGSSVLVIHSGGLQGNRSLPAGLLNF